MNIFDYRWFPNATINKNYFPWKNAVGCVSNLKEAVILQIMRSVYAYTFTIHKSAFDTACLSGQIGALCSALNANKISISFSREIQEQAEIFDINQTIYFLNRNRIKTKKIHASANVNETAIPISISLMEYTNTLWQQIVLNVIIEFVFCYT